VNGEKTMRTLLITLFLANIVFLFGSIPWWTKTGAPNELGFQIMLAVVFCVGFCIMMGMCFVAFFMYKQSISDENLSKSNSEYQLSEEQRRIMSRRCRFIEHYNEWLGVVMFLCLLFAQWASVQTCQNPAQGVSMLNYASIALNVFGIFVFVEMILLPLLFRLPKEKE
jgi:hypothetical protein